VSWMGIGYSAKLHFRLVLPSKARANYQALAEVARAVFARDPATRAILGLKGTTPVNTVAFKAVADQLFDNALNIAAIGSALAQYGYDRERLTHDRAAIAAFGRADQAQLAAMGAAQQATRNQQAALAALKAWLSQYLRIARVALRTKPELYAKLGGVVRSSRTAAQRQAPQEGCCHPRCEESGIAGVGGWVLGVGGWVLGNGGWLCMATITLHRRSEPRARPR
jgi:hypothetical protein